MVISKIDSKTLTKINTITAGSYEPTLADCQRIYKEYSPNKGELAGVLADVFAWLAQEPISRKYKRGMVYMRAEVLPQMVFCIHFIYVDKESNISIESKMGTDNDITNSSLDELFSIVKDGIEEEIMFYNEQTL